MASRLDKLLEPGERVVWRYPRGSLYRHPSTWGWGLGTTVFFAALWIWHGRETEPFPWMFGTLFATGLGAYIYLLAPYTFKLTSLALTDRRVFQVTRGWKTTTAAIPLGAIRALDRLPCETLVIRGEDGTVITATPYQKQVELAGALAAATGLPAPSLMGPKGVRLSRICLAAFLVPFLTAGFLFAAKFPGWAGGSGLRTMLLILAAALGFTVVYQLCYVFGAMVGLVLGRGFMSADEMRRNLWRDVESLDRRNRVLLAILLPLATLLYGQPMDNPNAGGETRG